MQAGCAAHIALRTVRESFASGVQVTPTGFGEDVRVRGTINRSRLRRLELRRACVCEPVGKLWSRLVADSGTPSGVQPKICGRVPVVFAALRRTGHPLTCLRHASANRLESCGAGWLLG